MKLHYFSLIASNCVGIAATSMCALMTKSDHVTPTKVLTTSSKMVTVTLHSKQNQRSRLPDKSIHYKSLELNSPTNTTCHYVGRKIATLSTAKCMLYPPTGNVLITESMLKTRKGS